MSETTFSIEISSLSQVAAEAAALRDLLARQVPAYRRSVGAVSASEGESSLIRAFWSAVGWSPVFERCRLAEPEVPAGVAHVRRLLVEYHQGDPTFTLTEASLPSRFRLAYVDREGIGFAITDEREGVADPPMLAVRWDTSTIGPEYPSYLNWCANEVVQRAFEPWYNTLIRFSDMAPFHAADAPFPVLSPATRRLTDELWLTPNGPTFAAPGKLCNLASGRFEALVEWLFELEAGGIEISVLPGDTLAPGGLLVLPSGLPSRLRTIPGLNPGRSYRVGWIGETGVILQDRDGRTDVGVNPRHRAALEAALRGA
jgi:hypothetical protein